MCLYRICHRHKHIKSNILVNIYIAVSKYNDRLNRTHHIWHGAVGPGAATLPNQIYDVEMVPEEIPSSFVNASETLSKKKSKVLSSRTRALLELDMREMEANRFALGRRSNVYDVNIW